MLIRYIASVPVSREDAKQPCLSLRHGSARDVTTHAIVSTEGPSAPILLQLYADGLAGGRVELSAQAAVQLAADLLVLVVAKGGACG